MDKESALEAMLDLKVLDSHTLDRTVFLDAVTEAIFIFLIAFFGIIEKDRSCWVSLARTYPYQECTLGVAERLTNCAGRYVV